MTRRILILFLSLLLVRSIMGYVVPTTVFDDMAIGGCVAMTGYPSFVLATVWNKYNHLFDGMREGRVSWRGDRYHRMYTATLVYFFLLFQYIHTMPTLCCFKNPMRVEGAPVHKCIIFFASLFGLSYIIPCFLGMVYGIGTTAFYDNILGENGIAFLLGQAIDEINFSRRPAGREAR
jgi:hypothetical protein